MNTDRHHPAEYSIACHGSPRTSHATRGNDRLRSNDRPPRGNHRLRQWPWLAVLAVSICVSLEAQAQDPFAPTAPPVSPFGGAPTTPGSPFGGAPTTPGSPFGAAPTTPGSPFGAAPVPSSPAPATDATAATDPIAQMVLDQNPQTVDELIRAVRDLTNLGNAELVKSMVDKINKSNPDANQLADLEQRWGAALFMQLALEAPYAPEARLFAQNVLDAAKARRVARPRLDQLTNEMVSDNPVQRRTAISELKIAGEAIFTPLLSVLGDASREKDQAKYVAATVLLGDFVEPALLAGLNSDNTTLQIQAMRILATRRSDKALPWMLAAAHGADTPDEVRETAIAALETMVGGVPSQDETIQFLKRRAKGLQTMASVGSGDAAGKVREWTWDSKSNVVTGQHILARDAAILREERVAKALHTVEPMAPEILRLRLITALAAAKVREGIDVKITNPDVTSLCLKAGPGALVDALSAARKEGRTLAAAGAAEMLGELNDPSVVFATGRPSVLCDSMNADSPRVRFAALEAIMKLDPPKAFWGSSVAMERLTQAVTASGKRRVLIGHTRISPAQTWVGMLMEMGLEADISLTGRQLAHQAPRHIDYNMVLLPDTLARPGVRETIQRLREQPTCQHLPIGILCPGEKLFATKQIALEFDRVEAFPIPHTASRMYEIVSRLEETLEYPPMTPALRLRQGRQALGWLARMADKPGRYQHFELARAEGAAESSLYNPQTSSDAAAVLGKIATRQAQLALLDMASVSTLPVSMRRSAVTAFQEAVKRRGLLLVEREVHQQYDRYNQSRFLPKETQQLMGMLLDVIEGAQPKSALPAPPVAATGSG